MTDRAKFGRWSGVVKLLALCTVLLGVLPYSVRAGGIPGKFDYYVLALSWSPTYCEAGGRKRRDPQCTAQRPYAFVLHGLWPQYAKGWPDNCSIGRKPWFPRVLIDAMLDIMPSPGLVIQQYRKHGTCSGLSPEAYYELSRKLYDTIQVPARYLNPDRRILVSPKEIEDDFLKTNHAIKPDMISVSCGRGKRLREIRICFSKDGNLTPCGHNENQAKLCRLDKIVMPPVRGGNPQRARPQ
ncbi:MAG: ribonuclease T2 family protein [Methyloligellaceae bacterium]